MNCSETKAELSAYIDGELSEDLTQRVRNHISDCVACQEDLALLQAARNAFEALPAERVSFGFGVKVHAAHHGFGLRSVFPWWRLLVPVALAAAVVLVLVGINSKSTGEGLILTTDVSDELMNINLLQQRTPISGTPPILTGEDPPGLSILIPCLHPGDTSPRTAPLNT